MTLHERVDQFHKMLTAELRNEESICNAIDGTDHPPHYVKIHKENRATLGESVEYSLCIKATIKKGFHHVENRQILLPERTQFVGRTESPTPAHDQNTLDIGAGTSTLSRPEDTQRGRMVRRLHRNIGGQNDLQSLNAYRTEVQ